MPAGRRRAMQICAALSLIVLTFFTASVPLRAQRNAKRGAQPSGQASSNANTSAAGKQDKPKRVFISRSSDSGQGSRQTIKSDNPLNDYSAYRSGDRFYVVLPKADADALPKGGGGRGFSDMQVQRRGNDVVLSYKVQPGSKPRVEQKFNRLDVIFDTDGSAAPSNTTGRSTPPQTTTPNETRNPVNNTQPPTQNEQQQQPSSSGQTQNPNERRTATNAERNDPATMTAQGPGFYPQPGSAGTQPQLPTTLPPPTPETSTVAPSATPAFATGGQLAQVQPPVTTGPITTTTTNTAATSSGTSLGALVLRNWPVALILGLLVVGVGLLFVSRRSGRDERAAVAIPSTKTLDASIATPLAAASTAKLPKASAKTKTFTKSKGSNKKSRARTADPTPTPTPTIEPKPVVAASTLAASTLAASTLETAQAEVTAQAEPATVEEKAVVEETLTTGEPSAVVEPSIIAEAQPEEIEPEASPSAD
ncbi:MAG: hypothetical protein WCD76_12710, partial [Pyrinomonadaceae bacterium]